MTSARDLGRVVGPIACAAAAVGSATVAWDEWHVQSLAAVASRPDLTVRERERRMARCDTANDERVLLACASGYAALAARSPDPSASDQFLMRADAAGRRLRAALPGNGTALAMTSYLATAAQPPRPDEALADLRASYRAARFLREAALYRIAFGANHWRSLDRRTRAALLDEALWAARLGKEDRRAVLAAVAGTPPYVTLAIRLPGRGGEALPLPR